MLKTVSTIVNESIALFKKNFNHYLALSFLSLIPFVAAFIFSLIGLGSQLVAIVRGETNGIIGIDPGFVFLLLLSIFIIQLGTTFVSAAIIYRTKKDIAGEPTTFGDVVSRGLHLLIPTFIGSVLTTFIIFGGFLLLIIPGIIFTVWYAFIVHDIIIHKTNPIKALGNSYRLVKGRWWGVLWRLLATAILMTILLVVAQLLVTLPFDLLSAIFNDLSVSLTLTFMSSILTMLVNIALYPILIIPTVIIYLDLAANPVHMAPVEKEIV